MPKPHTHLIEEIASFENLLEASRRALRGKRNLPGPANFQMGLEKHLLRLRGQLKNGTWQPSGFRTFMVKDPKPRMISAAPFADRVVHHALCRVIEPIFERGFIDDSYANRKGYGTHRAVARYEHYRDRHAHVLRGDIFRYFPSIDHDILKRDLRRRIACAPTLALLDAVIDGSNPQEPVYQTFPGDDLFTPLQRRHGLPIGNLTSQFFANVYLDGLDHFVKEVLRAPYVRYVDDMALFHDDPAELVVWRERIETWLIGHRLKLHPGKTRIVASAQAVPFLGYVLFSDGRRRLPVDNVDRFAGRLRTLRQRYQAGSVDLNEVRQRVGSWVAHAAHANTLSLRHALFRGGLFDPLREPDRPQSVSCAAAPGTTNPGTPARPNATGIRPPNGTITTASVSRAVPVRPAS